MQFTESKRYDVTALAERTEEAAQNLLTASRAYHVNALADAYANRTRPNLSLFKDHDALRLVMTSVAYKQNYRVTPNVSYLSYVSHSPPPLFHVRTFV